MSRIVALTLSLVALCAAGLATASVAAAEDEGTIYQRYADIRERLYSCRFDELEGTQSAEGRAACGKLARYYVLYSLPGEFYTLHVHCRSAAHCVPTPSGEPAANEPYPAGAQIIDIPVSRPASHPKKKKHRHHRARSRRSQAAHGSAAAAR